MLLTEIIEERADVFFVGKPFETLLLRLGDAICWEDLQGTEHECSEWETDRCKCEIF